MNPISRRAFTALAAPAVLRGAKTPNFLLLMTDQQTHNALSCAGNPWLKTPAMDSLGRTGTRYTSAYCAYPVCSPSRSSIFTGAMPHNTGVMSNGKAIPESMPTLGELFRKAGYQTAYGGKWHLPKSFDGMRGFDKIIGGSGQGKDMDAPLAAACETWLRAKPKEPFLLVASFMNPHDICQWIRDHEGQRPHPQLSRFPTAPRNMDVDPNEPECIQYHREQGYDLMSKAVGIASKWRAGEFREYLHDYYRMVEAVDHQIGRVLAALDAAGLAQNTFIAFCSDHGEGMGAHRWVQKASFYEESARVPLIFRGPGIPVAKTDARLCTLADILPTFCSVAGIKPPETSIGVDLTKPSTRQFIASDLRYEEAARDGRMIRTAQYKYIRFATGKNSEQLFDLESDPGETRNLATHPGAKKDLDAHRKLARTWAGQTADASFA